jgi:hypothetical protein
MPRTRLAVAVAVISSLSGCAEWGKTQTNTPESMCATLGGRAVYVDTFEPAPPDAGTLVGSVGWGGRMYKCFDPNDAAFREARDGAATEAAAMKASNDVRIAALLQHEAEAQREAEEEAARRAAYAASPEGRAEAAAAAARDRAEAVAAAARDAAYEADLQKAEALVRGYKHCMVDADSTLEARKLHAYERTLYVEYLQAADARCRQKNRCDWAEKVTHSNPELDTGCYYDTPGW